MIKSWLKYTFQAKSGEADEIASELMLCGAEGAVVLSDTTVEAYFLDLTPIDLTQISATLIAQQKIENKNWVQQYPEILLEQKIADLTITPLQAASDLPHSPHPSQLFVIPGLGFGTGHHETTRSLIEWMQKIESPPKTVLDLGCGSGILAIAAKKLWDSDCIAIDNDADAVSNAKENASINKTKVDFICGTIDNTSKGYDLIFANLYAELLIELSQKIVNALNKNGILLLSGILANKVSMVLDAFAEYDLEAVDTVTNGNWSSIWYRRL